MPSWPHSANANSEFRSRILRTFGPEYSLDVTKSYLGPVEKHIPHHYLHRPNSGFDAVTIRLNPVTGDLLVFVYYTEFSEHGGGFVHGGAIAAMFDGIAAFTGHKFSNGRRAWTRVHETRFLKPVAAENDYAIFATILKREENENRIKLDVKCELTDKDGEVLAESSTIVLVLKNAKGQALPKTKL